MERKSFVACNAELVKIRLMIESIYYDDLSIEEKEELRRVVLRSVRAIEKHIKGEK